MDGGRDSPKAPRPRRGQTAPGGEAQASLTRALAPLRAFQTGRQLGHGYVLGPQISSGAQGDVFAAAAERSGEALAIKRVRVSSATVQRHAQQELTAVLRARARHAEEVGDESSPGHPCIVAYRDWFAGPAGLEREVCIVMERCDFCVSDMVFGVGQARGQYEKKCRCSGPPEPQLYRLTERELVKVMYQMLSALDFLNRHGIFHRDLKTDNILWLAGRPAGLYKLADFGTAACQAGGELLRRSDDCGTLWTMAPELLGRRPHGPNCDVWSLGVTLLEMGLLDRPFASKELLAYRNMFESSIEGSFWPVMLQAAGLVPPGPGGVPKTVPRSAQGKAAPKGLERPISSPSLTGARGPRSPASSPHSPPLGVGRRRPKPSALPPLQPQQPQPQPLQQLQPPSPPPSTTSSADPLGGGSPPSPASPQAAEQLRANKQTFLRKRCGSRWCYGGELATVLLDILLEEDSALRAPAAGVLAAEPVKELLAAHGLGSGIRSAPAASNAPAEAFPPDGGPEAYKKTIQQLLMHVTGESFHEALTVDRLRHKAAVERAEQRRASLAAESTAEPRS